VRSTLTMIVIEEQGKLEEGKKNNK
jgi:hypothetical protein